MGETAHPAAGPDAPGPAAAAALFAGAGEVRALARTLDWGATPLGWPDRWSPALRIATRALLDAPHPICLWAGPEYALVYNDAYRRILAAKHPAALGRPGSVVWAEIWPELAPQFAQVSAGGPPVYGEDARFVMARLEGGGTQDAWFSYSLSAVRDEDGRIVAVFNISPETTARVRAEQALAAERERLAALILAMPAPVALHWGPTHRFTLVNDAYRRHSAGGRDVTGLTPPEAFPDIAGQGFFELLDRVYATGEGWLGHEMPFRYDRRGAGVEETWWTVRLEPVREADGRVAGILSFSMDVTDQVRARREVERLLAESERARAEADAERTRATGILEATSDAYFALDGEYRIVAVNAAMARSTGLTRDALLGRVFWEVFPATVGTAYERHYRAAATEGKTAHFTDAYDDGRLALVSEADVYPVAGGGVAVFWRDVTARVRAEAALRESEALARQLFALSPVPKWVYDAETLAFLDVNDAAVRHYGYTREEFLAMTLRDIRPPEDIPRMLAAARAPHPTGASQGVFRHRTKSGEVIDVEVFLRDVPYAGRRAVIAVVQDVTERRRAEAALREASHAASAARDAAEAANAAKTRFLSTMSHELRTPLNAIGGYAELLELGIRGPVTAQQREDLSRIQRSQRHLLGLVNEVLNYAKLESGTVRYAAADVPVHEALADAAALLAPQARAKRLTLDVGECPPGLAVRADPEKLRQVLVNLLGNAIKFTDRGGAALSVTCDDAAGTVAIRVRDTGIGIPADKLEVIFEPFVQVRADLTRTAEGTGLGLAISRDLARGMGGDLTAESTPGVGSTFTLTLPAA